MLLTDSDPIKRLAIYFFYDKDGIVDDYNIYLLKDINKNVSETIVVCNGKLNAEGRMKFESIGCKVYVRENEGFDVWAYKEAMEYYGWDKLAELDELVLFNFTIFGPLYPFSEMFEEMNKLDLDFWGITLHHGADFDPWGKLNRGYLPLHLQSHFIVVRNSMLKSIEYKRYWDNMRPITSYEEAVSYHEAIFTETFAEKGFKWKAYVDTSDLEKDMYYPLIDAPVEIVKNIRCPIIKRKSFFLDIATYLNETGNEQCTELLDFIKSRTDYDVNLIWENILRTCNLYDIKNCLSLNYILPSDVVKYPENTDKKRRVALVMHIYLLELADYCLEYAKSMPAYADVYITTDTEEKKDKLTEIFKALDCNKLEVLLVENRGRDVSALIIGCRDILLDYDYVCFAHDKSPKNVHPSTVGKSFSYMCYEGVLRSKNYVLNILETFDKNSRLGLLTPPPPNHSVYYPTLGWEWTSNAKIAIKLASKLKLNVDITPDKPPIAPLGTIFWFRPKALKTLFEYEWKYSDFPEEPAELDGTILHGIERLYPYVVQNEGFYPAWVMPDKLTSIYITNLYYFLRTLNIACFNGNRCTHESLIKRIENLEILPKSNPLVMFVKSILPPFIYNVIRSLIRGGCGP